MEDGSHEHSPSCELEDGSIIPISISGRGAAFWEQKMESGEFKSGETVVSGCEFVPSVMGGTTECVIPEGHTSFLSNFVNTDNQEDHERRKLIIEGNKTILVVRVIAADGATTASEGALGDFVFGTDASSITVATQYKACSYGQLNFLEADDRALTGTNDGNENGISNGATTVRVDMNIVKGQDYQMVVAITDALEENFGVSSPLQLADHVMYCLPKDTMNGIAYAYDNHWFSAYDDDWCNYVSVGMHEIGHNLNLHHSGESTGEYHDQSGMVRDSSILTDSFLYYKHLTHQFS
jgi:hypothetical protein